MLFLRALWGFVYACGCGVWGRVVARAGGSHRDETNSVTCLFSMVVQCDAQRADGPGLPDIPPHRQKEKGVGIQVEESGGGKVEEFKETEQLERADKNFGNSNLRCQNAYFSVV